MHNRIFQKTFNNLLQANIPEDLSTNTSTLVLNGQFRGFLQNDKADFFKLCTLPGIPYFDRTHYISVIGSYLEDVLLFLRPHRFGKSLTLSMLSYFHGVEHKRHYDKLFKGLAVNQDVRAGTVKPNQYFILSLNFAASNCKYNPDARAGLYNMINEALLEFYTTYAPYLNDTAEQLIQTLINRDDAIDSFKRCLRIVQSTLRAVPEGNPDHPLADVKGLYLLADEYDAFANEYLNLKGTTDYDNLDMGLSLLQYFWASVKYGLDYQKIEKCFITGVLPLSLVDDAGHGFNVATNISSKRELAGFCGLSYGDVRSALKLICSNEDVEKHFRIMVRHYNGYCFSPHVADQRVFNTNTLEYLQSIVTLNPIDPSNPSNWRTSETLLQMLASLPIAIDILEKVGGRDFDARDLITYDKLLLQFQISDLNDARMSKATWLSFMRYAGGLTYAEEEPGKQLRIPNLVQVQRFAVAVLNRYQLRITDIEEGLRKIATTGDISQLLGCYERLMSQRDVGFSDFERAEPHHRDSFYFAIFKNPLLLGHIEFKVKKVDGSDGRTDLIIEIPSTGSIIIIEFKVIQIDYLNVTGATRFQKALTLNGYPNASEVLKIRFALWDAIKYKRRAGKAIIHWILKGPAAQLASYCNGPNVANMRKQGHVSAYLVVIVGSRKVLFSRLGADSQLEEFKLASCS